jgi:hypothetical protein
MLTLVARINIYSSSQRLTRSLLFHSSISSNIRQYHHSEGQSTQPQFSHYLVSLHSWKLTHQPREPSLHWNSRFRPQQQIEVEEHDQPSENWDLWFQQHSFHFLNEIIHFHKINFIFLIILIQHQCLNAQGNRHHLLIDPINGKDILLVSVLIDSFAFHLKFKLF